MKPGFALLAILSTACAAAGAQVAPAITAPAELPLSGSLRYDLRYTEMAEFYSGSLGDSQTAALSGDVTYANASSARPFRLTYAGGDLWNLSGASGDAGVFQHLMASQGLVGRKWTFNLSDDVGYYQQAPTTGFSGTAGVGSLPSEPGQPSQPVLSVNTRNVSNGVSSNYTHSLGAATSLDINASYSILRYPDGNGLDDNAWEAGPRITRRLGARNSIFGLYSISSYSYPENDVSLKTQSAQFGYMRTWGPRFKTSVSAGPEWTTMPGTVVVLLDSSLSPPAYVGIKLPASTWTGLSVNASAVYSTRTTSFTASYIQATSAGGGVLQSIGSKNDDLNGGVSRQFGRDLTVSATGGYMRTKALISGIELELGLVQPGGVTDSEFGGMSATRRLGRYFSVFANYTAIDQSYSSALPGNAISGLSQVIGFGISYSPREKHFQR